MSCWEFGSWCFLISVAVQWVQSSAQRLLLKKKLEIGEKLNILMNLSDKKMLGYWNKTRGTKEKLMSKTQHEGILNVNIETVYGMPILTLSSYLFFTLLEVDWFLIDFDHIKSIRNRVLVCPVLLSSIHYL